MGWIVRDRVSVDGEGVLSVDGVAVTPETGIVVLDERRSIRAKVGTVRGKGGSTLFTLTVRSPAGEYVLTANKPGKYNLLPKYGHRVVEPQESKHPLERVLREEQVAIAICSFYCEITAPTGTNLPKPESRVWETSTAVRPWTFVAEQTAVVVRGGPDVRFGEWESLGVGLGRRREVVFTPSPKGVMVVVSDVRVGRHPGTPDRRLQVIRIGKNCRPEDLKAALVAAKTERLDVIQAASVSTNVIQA